MFPVVMWGVSAVEGVLPKDQSLTSWMWMTETGQEDGLEREVKDGYRMAPQETLGTV